MAADSESRIPNFRAAEIPSVELPYTCQRNVARAPRPNIRNDQRAVSSSRSSWYEHYLNRAAGSGGEGRRAVVSLIKVLPRDSNAQYWEGLLTGVGQCYRLIWTRNRTGVDRGFKSKVKERW